MRIVASPEAIDLVRGCTGRLYVWQTRSHGCQGMTLLEAGGSPPRGVEFHRTPFDPFELHLAHGGPWPDELVLEARDRRVTALWDGCAWRI